MNWRSEYFIIMGFLAGCALVLCGLLGCQPARWCEGDPRLTPVAAGSPVVLERIEIGIGMSTSISGSAK